MTATPPNFAGKRVLVTGASRGVGAATAKAFARLGATAILTARSADRLEAIAGEIRSEGGCAEVRPADLSTREACRSLALACGEVDVLINNASETSSTFQSVLKRDDAFWDLSQTLCFLAPLTLMQELVPGMIERGQGVVLNISSMAAQRPVPYRAPYSIYKGALETLSKVAGLELAAQRTGVRVNAVALGATDTEALAESCGPDLDVHAVIEKTSPLGRAIAVEEVADFCVYLASDSAAPILGTVLNIDGGMTAGSYSFVGSYGSADAGAN